MELERCACTCADVVLIPASNWQGWASGCLEAKGKGKAELNCKQATGACFKVGSDCKIPESATMTSGSNPAKKATQMQALDNTVYGEHTTVQRNTTNTYGNKGKRTQGHVVERTSAG
eukprot:1159922-Pelagomonas_calceolata.AAC.4